MASKLLHLRSNVPSSVPSSSELEVGQLAINTADKKLFIKDSSGNIVSFIDSSVTVQKVNGQLPNSSGEVTLSASAITSGIFPAAQLGNNSGNNKVLTTDNIGNNVWVNKLPEINLSAASAVILGSVKIGSGVSVTADGTISVLATSPFQYVKCYWIDGTNGLDTNSGNSIEQPWKILTKAASTITGSGNVIFIAPGNYAPPVIWTAQNADLVGMASRSSLVNITGLFTFNHPASSVRVSNIAFNGGLTLANAGDLYLTNCQVTNLIKSGTGYYESADIDYGNGVINVTGAGSVVLFAGKYAGVTVNNASALVSIANAFTINGNIQLTAGILRIEGSPVFTSGSQTNAITTVNGSTLILSRASIYDVNGIPTKITVAGFYSLDNVLLNLSSSIFTGATNLQFAAHFDAITAVGGLIKPAYPFGIAGNILSTGVNPGSVGEYIESLVENFPVPGPNAGFQNVTTINLSAGEWDISAQASPFHTGSASYTLLALSLTAAPNVFPQSFPPFTRLACSMTDNPSLSIPAARGISDVPFTVTLRVNTSYTGSPISVSVGVLLRARRVA